MLSAQQLIENLLTRANITINGDNPWDVKIHNTAVYQRVVKDQALGLGEAYMEGWWDTPHLDQFFYRLLNARLDEYLRINLFKHKEYFFFGLKYLLAQIHSRLFNQQNHAKAFEVGEAHYDIGNDLFQRMLDKELTYTCGYWLHSNNLDDAQAAKLKLVCDKLGLKPGQKILDIGCGWGSFARFAARHYGVSVVGVTVSKQQKQLADELNQGLPIEIRLEDYRNLNEQFDHIVSLGMFEHVGYKNYTTYMDIAGRCLKEEGLFLLHTIGANTTSYSANPWIQKYIFPNGMIPSIQQIGKAIENRFVMEDWHNFGADYDRTLMTWQSNFSNSWEQLRDKYSERFYRMWNYYLLTCAGAFRARELQLWQIVLSKRGVPGGYLSIRP